MSGSDPSQLNVNFIGDIPKVLGYKVESVTVKGTIEVTLGRKEPRILSKDLHDFVMGLADVCDLGECKIHIISTNEAHVLDQHRHERIAVRQQHDGDGDAIIFQCVFFDGVMASTGEGCQHQTESNCFGYPSRPCKSVDYGRALQVLMSKSKDFFEEMYRYRSGKVPDFSAYSRLLVDPFVLDDAPLRVPAAQAAPEVVEAKPAKDPEAEVKDMVTVLEAMKSIQGSLSTYRIWPDDDTSMLLQQNLYYDIYKGCNYNHNLLDWFAWSSQTDDDQMKIAKHVLDTVNERRRTKREQQQQYSSPTHVEVEDTSFWGRRAALLKRSATEACMDDENPSEKKK